MDPLLCFPADLPAEVTLALQSAGLGPPRGRRAGRGRGARPRRARRRLLGCARRRRRRHDRRRRVLPPPAPARGAHDPAAPRHRAGPGGRAPAARRPLRRLLRPAGPARGARGAPAAPLLAHRAEHAARHHRVRALDAQPRDLPGRRGGPCPRPDLHGVRAPALPGRPPGQGLHPRDPAQPGLGLRVLRRRAHGRRPHPAPAGQARRGARPPDPDRALRRLPLRAGGLAPGCGPAQRRRRRTRSRRLRRPAAPPRPLRRPARRPRPRPRPGPRSAAPPPRRPTGWAGSR